MKNQDSDTGGGGRDGKLPLPDTDFSPTLQRVIMRKIQSGEDPGIDREEFFRLLGRVAKPQESDQ